MSHKNTAPQSHNRNLGAVQHVVTPAAAWHVSSWATKPVPEKRHENSQIFQPWVGPGGQRTKSCCWNTSQTEVDLLHKTCKLEVTPKLKAQLGTLTGSKCLGEWRNPESRGTARDSISRAPGQCDFTHKLCRYLSTWFLFWSKPFQNPQHPPYQLLSFQAVCTVCSLPFHPGLPTGLCFPSSLYQIPCLCQHLKSSAPLAFSSILF